MNRLETLRKSSAIVICKTGPRGLTDAFYGGEKGEKIFSFCDLSSYFKVSTFTIVERDTNF